MYEKKVKHFYTFLSTFFKTLLKAFYWNRKVSFLCQLKHSLDLFFVGSIICVTALISHVTARSNIFNGKSLAGGGKLDEMSNIIDDNDFDTELGVIDLLISDASKAIDAGEFVAALEGFREALRHARRLFGESLEISELDKAIQDINGLLET